MKIAVSIPDDLFTAAEALAARLGVSRSRLYQLALARYLEDRGDDAVTAALDSVHAERQDAALDPALAAMQDASLDQEPW
ncbi:MAG TPA: ChpI protein [Candidatus Krumholzibacteria bacterium]|nr:ChpI protein [Candidatus Krumholzibacteria bacterium]